MPAGCMFRGAARSEDGMRPVIQMPCYDEEHGVGQAMPNLPDAIPGVDTIEEMLEEGVHEQ